MRTHRKRRRRSPLTKKLTIVFEDKELIVVNKPAGMLAVPIPGSRVKNLRDLLNELLRSRKQKAIIVHRIDRYTSGLMVFAKNQPAHAHLVKQFLSHTPTRIYLALVRGKVAPQEGELRHYLKLTTHGFRQVVVRDEKAGGTLAITRYRVVEEFPNATLLEVQLVTGLKNQIRVQLAAAGHPIIGDRHYVPSEKEEKNIDHQALHAYRLGFVHPRTGKYVEFTAEPPEDFRQLVELLKQES